MPSGTILVGSGTGDPNPETGAKSSRPEIETMFVAAFDAMLYSTT
jgi:hypothetical protein